MKLKILLTFPFGIISSLSFATINLNSATFKDLVSLGLTNKQSQNLLSHRKKYGDLVSIYELQVIPGFDRHVIEKILPFVFVEEFWPEDNISIWKGRKFIRRKKNWRLLFRYGRVLEIAKGYLTGHYVGSPDDFLTKINFSDQGYKFSLAYKKKYAEYLYPGHIGGYFLLEKKFIFDRLIFGDYQIGCGQSLVLNSAFSLYKILTNPDLAKHNVKIKQNSAPSKYHFRGLASSITFADNFESTFFYSYRFLNSKIENNKAKISYNNHYKTVKDLKNKNTLGEQTLGGILSWRKGDTEIGCNLVYTCFDHEIRNKSDQFQGRKNYEGSIFGETILLDRLNLFGEFTYLKSFSFVLGSALTFLKNITSSFLVRNLSPHLNNFYGKPFRENNKGENECGVCNVNYFKIKKFNITCAWDYFYFPQLKQKGLEKICKVIYFFDKRDCISLQVKDKDKKNVHKQVLNHTTVQGEVKKRIGNFFFISKVVYKVDKLKKKYGLGFLATVKYKFLRFNADIFGGTTLTEGINIYLREPMLRFCGIKSKMFNIPMLLCGGVVGYKFGRGFQMEILYNFSYAYKSDKTGLGDNEIEKGTKNFIQIQIVYDF